MLADKKTIRAYAAGTLAAALLPLPAVAGASDRQIVSLGPVHPVSTVDAGSRATVELSVTTSDGRPLAAAASVAYPTGTIVFTAGTPSGSVRAFTVAVPAARQPAAAARLPLSLSATGAALTTPTLIVNAHGLPYLDSRLSVDRRVADLMRRMTLDDKIGQMTQAERGAMQPDPTQIATLRLGSVLSGGGSVPDPEHPGRLGRHDQQLPAYALSTPAPDPDDLRHRRGARARQRLRRDRLPAQRRPRMPPATRAWSSGSTGPPRPRCAPPASRGTSRRASASRGTSAGAGRTKASARTPALVVKMETADRRVAAAAAVLATVKHYAGDGDTKYGTGNGDYTIDQGITVTSRSDFARIDLAPYVAAVRDHHVGSVMPSFSSVDWTEDGVGNPTKMHASKELISGVLKGGIGFDGFVISDWEGIHQIPDPDAPAGSPQPTAGQVRAGRERRHRHVHGAEHRGPLRDAAQGRGRRGHGEPGPDRRRGAAHPAHQVPASVSSSTRTPRRPTSTRSAARHTGHSPGRP